MMPRHELPRLLRSLATGALVAGTLCTPAPDALAQTKPFPQGGGYPHGYLPKTVSALDAKASYDAWKAKYVKTDCGGGTARVEFASPMGTTVSEGMGYGMVLAAYYGDRTTFDGLWRFVQAHYGSHKMMGWKVNCTGFIQGEGGEGSATDGDTDIAFALIAAVDQWGDAYRKPALDFLVTMQRVDYIKCPPPSGRNIARRGNWDGACDRTNTSYFMPGYLRVFTDFSGDPFWAKAADDEEAIWLANRDPKTGLIANESDVNGKTVQGQGVVDYNGCRISWRAVLDYLWFGSAAAKDVADRLTDFASGVGISKLVDGYNTDGTRTKDAKWPQLNAWVGSWATGAMSKDQPTLDAFAADFRGIDVDNGGYYGSSLRALYLLTLSGNLWKPGTPPTPGGGVMPAAPTPKLGRFGCEQAPANDGWGGATAAGAFASVLVLSAVRLRRRRS